MWFTDPNNVMLKFNRLYALNVYNLKVAYPPTLKDGDDLDHFDEYGNYCGDNGFIFDSEDDRQKYMDRQRNFYRKKRDIHFDRYY